MVEEKQEGGVFPPPGKIGLSPCPSVYHLEECTYLKGVGGWRGGGGFACL